MIKYDYPDPDPFYQIGLDVFFFFSCIKILYCPISTTTVQTLRGR